MKYCEEFCETCKVDRKLSENRKELIELLNSFFDCIDKKNIVDIVSVVELVYFQLKRSIYLYRTRSKF